MANRSVGLGRWHTALLAGDANLVIVGDSVTEGANVAAFDDYYINVLRDQLRHRFQPNGIAGGLGYAPITPGYNVGAVWTLTGTLSRGNTYGLGLLYAGFGAGAITAATATQNCTKVRIHYVTLSGFGTFTVKIDGVLVATINTNTVATVPYNVWESSALSAGSHTILIEQSSGTILISGVFWYDGDESSGIRVWNGARSGADCTTFNNTTTWLNDLVATDADLVLIELGANDEAVGTAATFKTRLRTLVDNIRAAAWAGPLPSIGFVSHAYRASGVDYMTAMEELAAEIGDVAWIDAGAALGLTPFGSGYTDGGTSVHLTDTGAVLFADAIYDAIIPASLGGSANPVTFAMVTDGVITGTKRDGTNRSMTALADRVFEDGPFTQRSDGDIARAVLVEEDTINWLLNPSAENSTLTGNAGARSSATVTSSTDRATKGSRSFKVVTPGSLVAEGVLITTNQSLGITGTAYDWVGQAKVFAPVGAAMQILLFVLYTDLTTGQTAGTTFTGDGDWKDLTVAAKLTTNSGKTIAYVAVIVATVAAQAITFYVDEAQVEQRATPTAYADGSMGTGYAWESTANNSRSTRSVQRLSLNPTGLLKATSGGVVVWGEFGYPDAVIRYLFQHVNGSGDRIYLGRNASGYPVFGLGSSGTLIVGGATIALDTIHCLALGWDGETARAWVNGVQVGIDTAYDELASIGTAAYVGGSGANVNNGRLAGLVLFDRMPTDDEVAFLAARTLDFSEAVLKRAHALAKTKPKLALVKRIP